MSELLPMPSTPPVPSSPDNREDGDAAARDPVRRRRARAFDRVADAYDRARPSYPVDAVDWLLGRAPVNVLELGAGTGKLTEQLLARRHTVTATDPSLAMLSCLSRRAPAALPVVAAAEHLPLAAQYADAVVAAQAFHWFDACAVLPEMVRVLRPGGVVGLLWNVLDRRVPWVRRLAEIVGEPGGGTDPTGLLDDSGLFGAVESSQFRFWQPLDSQRLRDLVMSRSYVAVLPEAERERVLAQVDGLYDEYGRGPDGMLLPYVTCCYRCTTLPWSRPESTRPDSREPDSDPLLIDFG